MPKLRLFDAVAIGLASMLGAGVFVSFGPAAALAGNLLPLAVIIAGVLAYLNAASLAQLARSITKSGGAYAYAREYLGKTWSFAAGIAFLVGKTASIASIALVVASYLGFSALFALVAIAAMTSLNLMGINRTAFGSKLLAGVTILFLAGLILISISAPAASSSLPAAEPAGLLGAAAFLFFAFAGYARVATLGPEVEDPSRNIPRAIWISLGLVIAIYLALSVLLTEKLGASLALTELPLRDLAEKSFPGATGSIALVAALAGLGSLLALLAGTGRTAAAMAQDGELPQVFAAVNSKNAPWLAELTVGFGAALLILTESVVFTIGLSSFLVLTYYAIANLAAVRQPSKLAKRRRIWPMLGLALCLAIGLSVPPQAWLFGAVILTVALALRWGLAKLS